MSHGANDQTNLQTENQIDELTEYFGADSHSFGRFVRPAGFTGSGWRCAYPGRSFSLESGVRRGRQRDGFSLRRANTPPPLPAEGIILSVGE